MHGLSLIHIHTDRNTMEAEQLNIIANTLADLSNRTRELRRYL